MCLVLENKARKQTAKKDIIVYKILSKRFNGEYITPFQGLTVRIEDTYTSELIRTKLSLVHIGLHSFIHKEDVIARAPDFVQSVIVKCMIPKGSKYYKGSCLGDPSYASNCLTYLELI